MPAAGKPPWDFSDIFGDEVTPVAGPDYPCTDEDAMQRAYSQREREAAAFQLQLEASNPDADLGCEYAALTGAVAALADAAYVNAAYRPAVEEQAAEAESMLRCGWRPSDSE